MHAFGTLAYREIKFFGLHRLLRETVAGDCEVGRGGDGGSPFVSGFLARHLIVMLARLARYPFHTVCHRLWVAKPGRSF